MSRHPNFKFCLYIAGNAQNSLQAIANLQAICHAHLPDRHAIEIVDVFKEPERALADGIFMDNATGKVRKVEMREQAVELLGLRAAAATQHA